MHYTQLLTEPPKGEGFVEITNRCMSVFFLLSFFTDAIVAFFNARVVVGRGDFFSLECVSEIQGK